MDTTVTSLPTLSLVGPQHDIPETVDETLATILAWPRPHLSFAELRFRAWLAAHINALLPAATTVQYLAEGVMYCTVDMPNNRPSTTLFSCHIDTVDGQSEGLPVAGDDGVQMCKVKEVMYDVNFGTIFLPKDGKVGTCLGADDGIGIWLMLKMLEAKVPGGYMFHTGEEVGGVGSRAVLAKNMDILKKYEVAIAFDRPRTNEVITHQGGSECASDKFGTALMTKLNARGFDYKLSRLGTFTDTKIYRGVIAECLNLGVGYENQHGRNETQDYGHAVALLDAITHIDWSALPVDRDPTKPDPVPEYTPYKYSNKYGGNYGSTKSYDTYGGSLFDDDFDWRKNDPKGPTTKKKAGKQPKHVPTYEPMPSAFDDLMASTAADLEFMCTEEPEIAAETLTNMMVEVAQLRAEVAVLRQLLKKD